MFWLRFSLEYFPILVDKSWYNDVCPSFMFKVKVNSEKPADLEQSEQYLVLWIDYLKEDERENTGSSRYTVITATATRFSVSEWDIEIGNDEESVTLFESEDPKALIHFLELYRLPIPAISETTN
ncbi:hypothetical protein FM038_025210 [Shewanella eurypsychrophilus]|uniref:Uncharacterized protein n=1 Tax=Shewanella eurypsychrophilus TaxID=2593656 RepID=A0ABX6VC58_9GAMM|nr:MULTISPECIES: hypothetical protein [Shewanella]QFU25096.1 hypothetical protein FS418_26835 [Shewanella sp. YLB-09]QPG60268.1 hypothetical protein FM038_025210 [Shewanella eurypsychrophilus]